MCLNTLNSESELNRISASAYPASFMGTTRANLNAPMVLLPPWNASVLRDCFQYTTCVNVHAGNDLYPCGVSTLREAVTLAPIRDGFIFVFGSNDVEIWNEKYWKIGYHPLVDDESQCAKCAPYGFPMCWI